MKVMEAFLPFLQADYDMFDNHNCLIHFSNTYQSMAQSHHGIRCLADFRRGFLCVLQQHKWLLNQRKEVMGKASQRPNEEINDDIVKEVVNGLELKFQRSVRQVEMQRADMDSYVAKCPDWQTRSFASLLNAQMRSRFYAYLTLGLLDGVDNLEDILYV